MPHRLSRLALLPILAVALVAAAPRVASAHPGIGIVMDRQGNVFYTDLEHVWRITPDGRRSIAVRGVHTHELALDAEGNLYGEHLWYEGEATDRWGHYVWRLRPGGALDTLIGPKEGFLKEYSFARDEVGTMYWVDQQMDSLLKRTADGRIALHARHEFRRTGWIHATGDGTLYLMDDGNLLRISPLGEVTTVAMDLARTSRLQPHVSKDHAVMGLWSDAEGNVYLASYGTREVKLVTPRGVVSVVKRSGLGWGPTGGLVAPNGDLWILESSMTNKVRVRRFAKDGSEREWR